MLRIIEFCLILLNQINILLTSKFSQYQSNVSIAILNHKNLNSFQGKF